MREPAWRYRLTVTAAGHAPILREGVLRVGSLQNGLVAHGLGDQPDLYALRKMVPAFEAQARAQPIGERQGTFALWFRMPTAGGDPPDPAAWLGDGHLPGWPASWGRATLPQDGVHRQRLRLLETLSDGQWHHLAWLFEETAKQAVLYLDGTQILKGLPEPEEPPYGQVFPPEGLLGEAGPMRNAEGADARLYDRGLDESEIRLLARRKPER
jgi:hypothetical protein